MSDWYFPKEELEQGTHDFRVNIVANYFGKSEDTEPSYIVDYFGMSLTNYRQKEDLPMIINQYNIIRGCYYGLHLQGIPIKTVELAKNNNHLTELMHTVFKDDPCKHYNRFLENDFVIDNGRERGKDFEYIDKLMIKADEGEILPLKTPTRLKLVELE